MLKTYRVTATYRTARYGSAGMDGGYEYTVTAATKADAVSEARKKVARDGHTKMDGALSYVATLEETGA